MLFSAVVVAATLFCTLVAGFLLGFAIVVMPGLGVLEDRAFLRGFQAMDRVIQDSQPVFVIVWGGSVLLVVAAVVLGLGQTAGLDRALLLAAVGIYLLGVQLPTFVFNIPLNNRVQALDLATLSAAECAAARQTFESRWNRANVGRTVLACAAAVLLLVLLLRL